MERIGGSYRVYPSNPVQFETVSTVTDGYNLPKKESGCGVKE